MWDGVLIYGGYLLGDNWHYFDEMLNRYNSIVLAAVIILALAWLTRKIILYYKSKPGRS